MRRTIAIVLGGLAVGGMVWLLAGAKPAAPRAPVVSTGAPSLDDEKGRIVLPAPPGRGMHRMGDAPGHPPVDPESSANEAGELTLSGSSVNGTATIRGHVRDRRTGAPVAGVTVGGTDIEGLDKTFPTCVSDSEGRFVLPGLRSGTVYLAAVGTTWISPLRGIEVSVEAGSNIEQDVDVVPGTGALGVVTDAEGRPLEGLSVRACDLPHGYKRFPERALMQLMGSGALKTSTDGTGAFAIPLLPPGRAWSFVAFLDGVPVGVAGPYPAESGAILEVEIFAADRRHLDCRVIDRETGDPVPGAEVTWWVDLIPDVSWPAKRGVTTGPDGNALVGPLPASRALVGLANARGRLKFPVEVLPDATGPITLRVPGQGRNALSIEGQVIRKDGTPAAGAEWSVEGAEECLDSSGVTDSNGRFHVRGLVPGPWTVDARWSQEAEYQRGHADVQAGDHGVVVKLRPSDEVEAEENPRGPAVRAVFTAPDGTPIPRGKVEWSFRPDGREGFSVTSRRFRDGQSEENPPLEYVPGVLLLAVSEPKDVFGRSLPFANEVFGPFPISGEVVTVTLRPEKWIEGRIVDEAGEGVTGAALRADPAERDGSVALGAEARSGVGGAFRIGNLDEGSFFVHVDASNEGFGRPAPVLSRSGGPGLVIVVRKAVNFALRIVDDEGKPVAHARIRMRAPGVTRRSEAVDIHSDARGVATLEGLDPEVLCSLRVDPPESRRDLLGYRVAGWKPASTEIRLESEPTLDLRDVEPEGAPR